MTNRGFTLVEILIAVLILGVVLTTVYASYTGTFRIIDETRKDAGMYAMARAAMENPAADMEALRPWKGRFLFFVERQTVGEKDFSRLVIRAVSRVTLDDGVAPGGVALVEYSVRENDKGDGFVLYRGEAPGGEDPKEAIFRRFAVCNGVNGFDLVLFDEKGDEHATWDSDAGDERRKTPAAVGVRLAVENSDNPDVPRVFETAVPLPVITLP